MHSSLDDYSTGVFKKVDFNADWYEEIYLHHMMFLSHIREGSVSKYHQLMADLYGQAL